MELAPVSLPAIGMPVHRPAIAVAELIQRCDALYDAAACDWVLVYGDREHNANLLHLTGFDPRFEEAILVIGPKRERTMVFGSEGMLARSISPLPFESIHCQPLSLMGQPLQSDNLAQVLGRIGVSKGDRVGLVGWKYLPDNAEVASNIAYVPVMYAEAVKHITGEPAADVTRVLMNPKDGQRVINSAAQIAQFEWGAARASAAAMRVVLGTRPGMTELDAAGLFGYSGEPLSMHPIVSSGDTIVNGLFSATDRVIQTGDGAVVGIGYWGGLTCRAGLVTDTIDDSFVDAVAKPYFAAILAWWQSLALDVSGAEINTVVSDALQRSGFKPLLNPGHLTSFDEWVHSFIREGSSIPVRSGMVLQCDIIPDQLAPGWAINCEDTVAVADRDLRTQIAADYPDVWNRIEQRRTFMRDSLGFSLHPEVLPLTNAAGWLRPFWLSDRVMINA